MRRVSLAFVAERSIYVLFFLSGFSALVYQLCWMRQLGLVLGTTLHSISITTSAFMAGLALGAWAFGRAADKLTRVMRFYAAVEGLIALTALALLAALSRYGDLVRAVHAITGDGQLFTLTRFVLTFALLLVPSTIIGGTLPVISRFIVRHFGALGQRVGLLYTINTLGAACGAAFTGYAAIELFGVSGTIRIAVALNALIALTAYLIGKNEPEVKVEPAPPEAAARSIGGGGLRTACAIAFFVNGFTGLAYEMVWTRLLVGFFLNRPHVFTSILVVLLLGLAAGGWIASRVVDRLRNPAMTLGLVLAGVALLAVSGLGYLEPLPVAWRSIRSDGSIRPWFRQALYTAMMIGPPCVVLGFAFPLITRVLVRDVRTVASELGRFYAVNTLGTIFGGLAGSFFFLEYIGASQSVVVLALINLAVGVLVLAAGRGAITRRGALIFTGLAVLTAFAAIPGWDSYHRTMLATAQSDPNTQVKELVYHEDAEATVFLFEEQGAHRGLRLQVNGSPRVAFLTHETKLMAHIPLLFVREAKRALVICFGMGNTFRSALAHGIEVDVAEINSTIPSLTRVYRPNPADTLEHPKGRVIINDGRNHLLMTDRTYDMITVDPAPPLAGVGTVNLYTREFFQLGKDRLSDGGIFMQWTPVYDGYDFVRILKAFKEVFEHVEVFRGIAYRAYYLIGSNRPIEWDRDRMQRMLSNPSVRADLDEERQGYFDLNVLSTMYIGDGESLADLTRDVPPMTDDHPVMEYALLRPDLLPKDRLPYPLPPRRAIPLAPAPADPAQVPLPF